MSLIAGKHTSKEPFVTYIILPNLAALVICAVIATKPSNQALAGWLYLGWIVVFGSYHAGISKGEGEGFIRGYNHGWEQATRHFTGDREATRGKKDG
jgi:hypothetical protein